MYGLEFGKVGGGPTSPMDTVLLFAMFACREMEAVVRLVGHLHIKEGKGCGVVALYLPASKTDVKGEGVGMAAFAARPLICAPWRSAQDAAYQDGHDRNVSAGCDGHGL